VVQAETTIPLEEEESSLMRDRVDLKQYQWQGPPEGWY
jgi:hypothetical protein